MHVAVITGAGRGIGFGTALKLRDLGFAVLGTGRDPAKLADLEVAFGHEDRIATIAVDVTADDGGYC